MDDHEKRLSVAETKIDNFDNVVIEIKDWMKNSSSDRSAKHNEIIQRLSVIETKQDGFNKYQDNCDTDRKKITNRISSLERSESMQSGKVSIINVVIAACTSAAIAIVAALLGKNS